MSTALAELYQHLRRERGRAGLVQPHFPERGLRAGEVGDLELQLEEIVRRRGVRG